MYRASFEYLVPSGINEAIALLQQYGEDAKLLAGGQSLVPMMKLRLAPPKYLIDLNRIALAIARILDDACEKLVLKRRIEGVSHGDL
jgi:CO/xanthine dehydrogenase FAD-binding subunit